MAQTRLNKAKKGYGYQYTDLSQINELLEERGESYYQFLQQDDQGRDYVYTVKISVDGKESQPIRGARVVNSALSGSKINEAQAMGAAITYARRYSLLMAYGLATTDDDAESLTVDAQEAKKEEKIKKSKIGLAKVNVLTNLAKDNGVPLPYICQLYQVKVVTDMTEEYFINATANIDKIKAKYEKSQGAK